MDAKVHTSKSFRHRVTLADVELFPLRAKGGVSPQMAIGTMPTRPALLVRLTDADGCFGWGEVWANFPPRANIHKAQLIEDVVAPKLKNMTFTEPAEATAQLRDQLEVYFLHVGQVRVFEHILAGFDIALWDLALRKSGTTFAEHMGIADTRAGTYASSINISDLEHLIPKHAALGQTHFKLKIGFLDAGDHQLIEKAHSLMPDDAHIMVDSNQSWNLQQAKDALSALKPFAPMFAEEPLRADAPLSDWETLANASSVPLAGGENFYGIDEFLDMASAGVRYLQPDVAKWGGLSGALELAARMPSGTSLWPHFMGTAVGQQAALCVTAALGHNSVCEMDVNENALRTNLCGDVLNVRNGKVDLPTDPGLVMPPTERALSNFQESTV